MKPTVLDACCGSRMFWFNRKDARVIFMDNRQEITSLKDKSSKGGHRTLNVSPDIVADFRSLPFVSNNFQLVIFDPPHLRGAGKNSWLGKKYGTLGKDWKNDLTKGFAECFRVLKPNGVLIFKWNAYHIPVREVLALTPHKPLVGHVTGRQSKTHWISFLKDGQ